MQKLFCSEKKLIKKFGKRQAEEIMARISELASASALSDSPLKPHHPRLHLLTGGQLKGMLSVDIEHPKRLLFKPAHKPVPRKPSGDLEFARITDVCIMGVKDTHG